LRIAIIGPVYPYRGGIAHFTSQLASRLIKSGHEVVVFSFQRQYPGWLYPGKTDQDPSTPRQELEAQYLLDPLYPWTWTRTRGEISKFNPDLVLFSWWTTFWGPAFWTMAKLLTRSGYKVIFLIHNVIPHEEKPWDRWIAKQVLEVGEAHIVQAEKERDRLLAILPGIEPVLCPHPVYDHFSEYDEYSSGGRSNLLKLDENLPVLLFFGIVRPYKGLKYLIEAVSILRKSGTTFQLVIAGEFWEDVQNYKDLIEQLQLSDQVFIVDRYIPDDEVSAYYNAADIFVAPYVDGTQSGSVKIALGFNLPIILTEPIVDDITRDLKGIFVVPPADSPALARAIQEMIEVGYPKRVTSQRAESSWDQLISTVESLIP
jgi:glycosyltransferase involved in cell wall biosynthesis